MLLWCLPFLVARAGWIGKPTGPHFQSALHPNKEFAGRHLGRLQSLRAITFWINELVDDTSTLYGRVEPMRMSYLVRDEATILAKLADHPCAVEAESSGHLVRGDAQCEFAGSLALWYQANLLYRDRRRALPFLKEAYEGAVFAAGHAKNEDLRAYASLLEGKLALRLNQDTDPLSKVEETYRLTRPSLGMNALFELGSYYEGRRNLRASKGLFQQIASEYPNLKRWKRYQTARLGVSGRLHEFDPQIYGWVRSEAGIPLEAVLGMMGSDEITRRIVDRVARQQGISVRWILRGGGYVVLAAEKDG